MDLHNYITSYFNNLSPKKKFLAYVVAGIFVVGNLSFWLTMPDRIKNTEEFMVAKHYVENNQELKAFLNSNALDVSPVLIDSKKGKTILHLIAKGTDNKTNVQVTLKKQANKWYISKAMMKIEEPNISIMPKIISGEWKELSY